MILYISRPLHLEFDEPFVFPETKEALTILELGSGTGIVASTLFATLATTGRHILYATDLPEVCPLLEENLRSEMACGSSQLAVRPLRWGSSKHAEAIAAELDSKRLTYIICSDLVCVPLNHLCV
jgi:methylase of polypeptide subunit release factors